MHTIILHEMWLVESVAVEPQIGGLTVKLCTDFLTVWGVSVLNYLTVEGFIIV